MKKIFFLTALLCASLMSWATVYDDTALTLDAGETEGQTLTLSICRSGRYTTRVVAKSTTSQFTGVYECIWQGHGNGTNPVIGDYTVTDNEISFETTWDTYPTAATQLRFVARRNNSGGGSDIFGGTATSAEVTGLCEGTVIKDDPGLSLNQTAVTLSAEAPAETFEIVPTRSGDGAISYVSNKPGIASVSSSGIVTAVGRGTATITVHVAETDDYSASSSKLIVTVIGPINWPGVDWLTYSDQYKLVIDPEISDGFGGKRVEGENLWVGFPSADFGACSIEYSALGAGVKFALSNFPQKTKNQFTMVCAGTTYTFYVYNDKGTDSPTSIDNTNVDAIAVKVIENGQLIIIKNGVRYNALGAQL